MGDERLCTAVFVQEVHGAEVLIVNKTLNGRAPNGVLLLFHGCSHSAKDWWTATPNCPNCTGIPLTAHTKHAKAFPLRDFLTYLHSHVFR